MVPRNPRSSSATWQEGEAAQPLPAWFVEMAHYEWAELAVDVMDAAAARGRTGGRPAGRPARAQPGAHEPGLPVAGQSHRPRLPAAQAGTGLSPHYRDDADKVRFVEINPVTSRLVTLLGEEALTGRQACLRVAAELQHPIPNRSWPHGRGLLEELRDCGLFTRSQTMKALAQKGLCVLDHVGLWIGLFSLRILTGWDFYESGLEKFNGENWFAGHPGPLPLPLQPGAAGSGWQMSTWFELIGGVALVIGLGTRFSVSLFVLTIVAIASVHWV